MQIAKEFLQTIDNPRLLNFIIIGLIAVIVFMLKQIGTNVKVQLERVIKGEKDKLLLWYVFVNIIAIFVLAYLYIGGNGNGKI